MDLDLDRCRVLKPGDNFQFGCQRCGACCDCEILLRPHDVLRVCEFLSITTGEFLSRYASIVIGHSSGLPVCRLDLERYGHCPFLTFEEVMPDAPGLKQVVITRKRTVYLQAACQVYPAAPTVCVSYPLGRLHSLSPMTIGDTNLNPGEDAVILQPVKCPGAEGRTWTQEEWVRDHALNELWAESHRFDEVCTRLFYLLQRLPDQAELVRGAAALLLYDFDNAVAAYTARHGLPLPGPGRPRYEAGFALLTDLIAELEASQEIDEWEVH